MKIAYSFWIKSGLSITAEWFSNGFVLISLAAQNCSVFSVPQQKSRVKQLSLFFYVFIFTQTIIFHLHCPSVSLLEFEGLLLGNIIIFPYIGQNIYIFRFIAVKPMHNCLRSWLNLYWPSGAILLDAKLLNSIAKKSMRKSKLWSNLGRSRKYSRTCMRAGLPRDRWPVRWSV